MAVRGKPAARVAALALTAALAVSAGAADPGKDDVSGAAPGQSGMEDVIVRRAWGLPDVGNQGLSAGYLTILNQGLRDDVLLGVEADAGADAELYEKVVEGTAEGVRPLESGLRIPAGGNVKLAPGGLHILFKNIESPLEEGETFPLRLKFKHRGEINVNLTILKFGPKPAQE